MNTPQEAAAASAAIAVKTTNIGAATAVGASFMANNWIGIAGLSIAVAGFLVNWYFKYKTYKLLAKKA